MTTTKAAEYLGVDPRTIFRLIKRNHIKAEKFGPVWMIDKKSLDEYQALVAGKSKHDPTRARIEQD